MIDVVVLPREPVGAGDVPHVDQGARHAKPGRGVRYLEEMKKSLFLSWYFTF